MRTSSIIYNQRLSRACIVHLVIKKTNWSYVKTMSCSGTHLGITINIENTKFVKDLPMIDAQFRFNQCNSFREEYISVFSPYGRSCVNTMTCGGSHLGFPIGIENRNFVEDLPMIIPGQFGFNCLSGFREEAF
jgi:hypothetical protein